MSQGYGVYIAAIYLLLREVADRGIVRDGVLTDIRSDIATFYIGMDALQDEVRSGS